MNLSEIWGREVKAFGVELIVEHEENNHHGNSLVGILSSENLEQKNFHTICLHNGKGSASMLTLLPVNSFPIKISPLHLKESKL